ncbi:MAG: hypothetical protein EBR82_66540 [Caulobacteraceae bacterium]|nr:hypothetical protein [Caulobacteraceae bacterium]
MTYYMAQLNERNGEYEYQHTILLSTEWDAHTALTDIAMNWYESAEDYLEHNGEPLHTPDNVVEGNFYFNGDEVCVSVGNWEELPKAVFDNLPRFLTVFNR